ncbi:MULTISPECIES: PaaI family thioesterase [Alloalcanivorax]|jgi:uncharacterized protein (TIGR00369 family)|uniref:Thioesterase family protein n=1 Tax=Alcanivorax dieselolei (strain DSM 16502 / CGMCC 1.3690 / MCCC 1A00001 / B-5) TaxID=930169 RepID=K0CAX7_ALCDB|nr:MULTISPECIES: PaaI family thioesterase [Alloalcanivorax]ERS10540.1 thioesterase [Alcanivorax sp. PN-3]KYZ86502.1 thioesterase [Alcanivorax sp. KX64203]MBA4722592.1 PaaI family thioesterase [Alcanivorax sp.]AFT68802.1 Thioesterase family protein [Alloalcanivorax dieselolei B5]MCE7524656.1 PaaI family thioesterase [Alloalcanivorax xenomutans]|tara:strand:- start:277 stop:714 length:438 start_codon:yes stop_codon:yes gene_type:complete
MSDLAVPAGYQRHRRASGLTAPWEPIFIRHHDHGLSLAIRADQPHANSRGFVHGGLISALADNAMGLSCADRLGGISGLVTVSMTLDFLGSARLGQWVEIRAEATRTGPSLNFAAAQVWADDTLCARATAVFKALAPRPSAETSA